MPKGSWHYEFICFKAHLLQRLDEKDGKPGAHFYKTRAPTSCQFFWEPSDGRLADFVRPRASLPRTAKDKPAYFCTPIIDGKKNLFEDPEVLLVAELDFWPQRLQEQAHGASARAQIQWEAQSGRRQRPHQLDDVEPDGSNKAEAACQVVASSKPTSVPTLRMSPPRLLFL